VLLGVRVTGDKFILIELLVVVVLVEAGVDVTDDNDIDIDVVVGADVVCVDGFALLPLTSVSIGSSVRNSTVVCFRFASRPGIFLVSSANCRLMECTLDAVVLVAPVCTD
jgi:hypothetical protein